MIYEKPAVRTIGTETILASMGPAQANASGVGNRKPPDCAPGAANLSPQRWTSRVASVRAAATVTCWAAGPTKSWRC